MDAFNLNDGAQVFLGQALESHRAAWRGETFILLSFIHTSRGDTRPYFVYSVVLKVNKHAGQKQIMKNIKLKQ